MITLTIKIDRRTKAGKAFLAMSDSFFKGVEGIEIVETDLDKSVREDKSSYNPEFISKIRRAEANIKKGNTTRLNPKDIWGSIL
jgi:DNA-directed RNA polymerase beta' subunit